MAFLCTILYVHLIVVLIVWCTMLPTPHLIPSSPFEEDVTDESGDSSEPMETAFTLDQTADGKFLSLDDLGKLLLHLAPQGLLSLHTL